MPMNRPLTEMRGLLAMVALIFVFTIALVQLIAFRMPPDVPAWATTTLGAIIGFYFGAHSPAAEQTQAMGRTVEKLADTVQKAADGVNGGASPPHP